MGRTRGQRVVLVLVWPPAVVCVEGAQTVARVATGSQNRSAQTNWYKTFFSPWMTTFFYQTLPEAQRSEVIESFVGIS